MLFSRHAEHFTFYKDSSAESEKLDIFKEYDTSLLRKSHRQVMRKSSMLQCTKTKNSQKKHTIELGEHVLIPFFLVYRKEKLAVKARLELVMCIPRALAH